MEEYKYNKYKLLSREAFIELKETEEEKQRKATESDAYNAE